jgi:cell division protein FtsQ
MTKKRNTQKMKISFKRKIYLLYVRSLAVLKLFLFILILVFLFTDLFSNYKKHLLNSFYDYTQKVGFSFEELLIQGQVNMPIEEILSAVNAKKNTPIFKINISDVRQRLADNKWVEGVIVQKKLPNKIYIAIVERQPIAIWQFENRLYLIDKNGNSISSHNIGKYTDMLHVIGGDANSAAIQLIEDLKRHPELKSKITAATRFGKRRWDLHIDNLTIKMPENDFVEAYDVLAKLYKKESDFVSKYKKIDLRDKARYSYESREINEELDQPKK